jgi:type I restriction enzyme M protein
MCGVLYDDGVSYGDYPEQLTYLIFLKMADKYSKPPYKRNLGIPEKFNWEKLYPLSGAEPEKTIVDPACGTGGFFLPLTIT